MYILSLNNFIPFILLFFFINGLFIPASNPVSASELVENSWNTKTSMSQARTNLGVVTVDGKIYAIGGATDKYSYVGMNEMYDSKTDTWVTMISMPTPRGSLGIVVYEDKIYCIGGFTNYAIGDMGLITYTACSITEVYDTVTDSWSTKASMPVNGSSQAHVINGKIYVLSNEGPNKYGELYTCMTQSPIHGPKKSAYLKNHIHYLSICHIT
jgi:N-acetylneuraminic acid mutarotase